MHVSSFQLRFIAYIYVTTFYFHNRVWGALRESSMPPALGVPFPPKKIGYLYHYQLHKLSYHNIRPTVLLLQKLSSFHVFSTSEIYKIYTQTLVRMPLVIFFFFQNFGKDLTFGMMTKMKVTNPLSSFNHIVILLARYFSQLLGYYQHNL